MAAPIIVFLAAGDNDIAVASPPPQKTSSSWREGGRNPTNKMAQRAGRGDEGQFRRNRRRILFLLLSCSRRRRRRRRRFKIAVFAPLWNWGRARRAFVVVLGVERRAATWSECQNAFQSLSPFSIPLSTSLLSPPSIEESCAWALPEVVDPQSSAAAAPNSIQFRVGTRTRRVHVHASKVVDLPSCNQIVRLMRGGE